MHLVLLLLTIFLSFNIQIAIGALYTPSDNVNILTSDNFSSFTVDQHQDGLKLHFVHFYANWCPHCRGFAPKFKEFVAQTTAWRDLIDISVVLCSDKPDQWDPLCEEYNVNTVPQFRLFWFKPDVSD